MKLLHLFAFVCILSPKCRLDTNIRTEIKDERSEEKLHLYSKKQK